MLEETGIHAEFESVLAFRHGHKGLFGKSDLFFVVRMRLKPGTDAKDLRAQVRMGGLVSLFLKGAVEGLALLVGLSNAVQF